MLNPNGASGVSIELDARSPLGLTAGLLNADPAYWMNRAAR
jgi:hypothetical protein